MRVHERRTGLSGIAVFSKAVMRLPRNAKPILPVAIVVVIGLAVTAIGFVTADRAEERRVLHGLEFRVEWRAKDLQGKISLAREALVATAIHAAAESQIDVEEFKRFTTDAAAGSKAIASIAWAEPVTREDRAAFEARIGRPISESAAPGQIVEAADRAVYTPIVIQNRFDDRPSSVGFDLSAAAARRARMDMARDSAAPMSLMMREVFSPDNPTFVTFWPIFDTEDLPANVAERRAHLRGYVVAVFRIVDMLNEAMADTPPATATIDFYLSDDPGDHADDASFRMVATHSPTDHQVRAKQASAVAGTGEYSFVRSFGVRAQRWRVEWTFSPESVAAERSIGPRAVLLAGLLLTAVLAAYSVGGIRRVSMVRTLVDKRTAELRESNVKLEQTNTKLEALIDASPYALVCLDADRNVILWNAAAEDLFGYTEAEVLGRPYPLVPSEERAEFDNRFRRLAAGEILRNQASRRRHRDGTAIDTSSSAAAFYDAAGGLLGVFFAIEDARERNLVQSQLRQAQKMEAIGQLTGGLAHDFNNLIGIVLGNLDLLAERYAPGSDDRSLTDPAIQAAERGAELTRQLLAFSRRQPLAPKLTNLPPMLEAMTQLLRRTLGEAITLELKIFDALWPVLIDVSQLESAILNLSVNARDAMANGGRLTVEAANIVIDEKAFGANLEAIPGDYVVIAVSDTGTGMPPDVVAHAFEPFFTTKGNGGTGLGLSMVHGFIKQSGGYTRIYSEPGHGTTVRIYLPRGRDGEVATLEAPPEESLPRGDEIVLVVEDSEGVRDLALRYLQSLGYHTIHAADGASALAILKSGVSIDLLFTDVVMPGGMDGRALADAARRLRPQLKILFTSGFTAAAVSAATDSQFGSKLLSKPYRKGEVARRVRAALDSSEA